MDCHACGAPVTLEFGPARPHSTTLTEAVLAAEEDERVEVTRVCWECGWREERRLRVESIETTGGDDVAVERASLTTEITDELAAIDSLATLEDALAEVRRLRGLEPNTDDTEDRSAE